MLFIVYQLDVEKMLIKRFECRDAEVIKGRRAFIHSIFIEKRSAYLCILRGFAIKIIFQRVVNGIIHIQSHKRSEQ